MLDTTTFATNNATIATQAAAIAAAFAANDAALATAIQGLSGAAQDQAGVLRSNYRAEIAKVLIAAGLRDVFRAARDSTLDNITDETVAGAGTTGLQSVWSARITAGQLGAHT